MFFLRLQGKIYGLFKKWMADVFVMIPRTNEYVLYNLIIYIHKFIFHKPSKQIHKHLRTLYVCMYAHNQNTKPGLYNQQKTCIALFQVIGQNPSKKFTTKDSTGYIATKLSLKIVGQHPFQKITHNIKTGKLKFSLKCSIFIKTLIPRINSMIKNVRLGL